MKNRNIFIAFIVLSGLLNSCMMFGGFVTKVYLKKNNEENSTIREALFGNYKIIANIPVTEVGDYTKYSIKIVDAKTNMLVTENEISLKIEKRFKSKTRHPNPRYRYRDMIDLNSEPNSKGTIDSSVFFYKYIEHGSYRLNFIINSIGEKELSKPINIVTYHKVN